MLDISPNMYNMAKSKIGGIANYISEDRQNTEVFIQGSFRYGTMIRPYHKDKAGDYDIDAVVRYDGDMKNNLPGNVKKNWVIHYHRHHMVSFLTRKKAVVAGH